jgi:hypothetical protein
MLIRPLADKGVLFSMLNSFGDLRMGALRRLAQRGPQRAPKTSWPFTMSGNSFGTLYCVTSFGESHGPAYGGVIDGCPPGLELCEADLQKELDRRKPGTSRHVTQRRESDTVELLSGVHEGRTTGTAIGFLIRNEDQRSKDYSAIAQKFRPGHADYTYWMKYGARDPRGGGRASARETAVRVAAGAIARKWLSERFGVVVRGYLAQLGQKTIAFEDWEAVGTNPFFAANRAIVPELEAFMDELRESGDSCGARVNVVAENVPPGWGEPAARRRHCGCDDVDQRGQGRRDRRRFRRDLPEGQRARRRDDAWGICLKQQWRRAWGHLDRPGSLRFDRPQADVEHPHSEAHHRHGRQCDDCRDDRPARSMRRHPRNADRRSDARLRADGSRASSPSPECGCASLDSADRRKGALAH